MRILFGAYVRENGEWRLAWQSFEPTGPHWYQLCGYRYGETFVTSAYVD